MKKTLSILLSILMLVSVLAPFSAHAQTETGSCGKNATYEFTDGVLTISGTGETSRGVYKERITKVIINEGITSIAEDAFYDCKNLEEVVFPKSLKKIHMNAFKGCESLKKIELPENLELIGSSAFKDCYSVSGTLTIPKNCKLHAYAFNYCKSLTRVVFEDGFSHVYFQGTHFKGCESIKSVYIPGSLDIEGDMFSDCTSLTKVTLCEGVKMISGFHNCTLLEKITLPKSTKTLINAVFMGCKKLKSVKIQSRIENISNDAFYNCPKLKSMTFPYGVDEIDEYGSYPGMGYINEVEDSDNANDETNQKITSVPIKGFKIYGKKCKAITDYCKKHEFKFIDMYDVKNATATLKSQTYSGKAKKPEITVKLVGTELKKGTDYTVKYSNNTKVGTAKVTITGKGKYKGTLTKTFKINPKPTELTKLTPKSKSFKAYWKKNKSQTSGYQIQYSVYKSFKNAKKVTVKGYKTGARTIKDLKSKKKYFVRARAYKVVNNKKYYSKWSESMTVKTK